MCDSVHSTLTISHIYVNSCTKIPKFEPNPFNLSSNPTCFPSRLLIGFRDYSITNLGGNFSRKDKIFMTQKQKLGSIHCGFSSNGFKFSSELNFLEQDELGLEFSKENDQKNLKREKLENGEFGALGFEEALKEKEKEKEKEKAKTGIRNVGSDEELMEAKPKKKGKLGAKSRKQLMKRSNLMAKQVIGIQSALSLGFVSQLWVDTSSWLVLEVEVRPSLLSSESGTVRLEDVKQVGDVVLVQDETFVFNELRTVGLETLVGYNVVTPGQRNLGKVRGFTFNINSGAVESLELDAFGYSIIPSSLVSTYALLTEDILDVVSDTIIVHEAAASGIQRLAKGFFGTNLEYHDVDEEPRQPVKNRKSRRKHSRRKSYPGARTFDDDLELPMDYM